MKTLNINFNKFNEHDWNLFQLSMVELFKDKDMPINVLEFIEGAAAVAKFKLENKCSDVEFEAWQKAGEKKKYFKLTLSQFRNDINEYVDNVIKTSDDKIKVKVLDKEISLYYFEQYWKFLINAKANYIGLDVFENRRAQLHQKIFNQVGLNRVSDRETELGEEIIRICELIENDKAPYEIQVKEIKRKLHYEKLI